MKQEAIVASRLISRLEKENNQHLSKLRAFYFNL